MLCDNPPGILLTNVWKMNAFHGSYPTHRIPEYKERCSSLFCSGSGRKCLLYLTPLVVLAGRSSCSTCREATNFGGEIIKEGIRFERSIIATNVSTHLIWTGTVALFALLYSSTWL